MKEITLNAQTRTEYGKKASRDLRRAGQIPAVFYGVEKDENGLPVAKSIKISEKELAKLLYTPNVYIVNLVVDGTPVKAILKDLQCDFVTDRPVHVDFYQITEDKPVVFEIPVKLNGLAEGVHVGVEEAACVGGDEQVVFCRVDASHVVGCLDGVEQVLAHLHHALRNVA
jgi:large subunit ribosomal protein L25